MNIIINNYKKICNMLKENLLKIVIGCTFIFIISIIIGMLYGTYNFNKTVENVVEFVQENEDYEPDNELKNALGFIKNNTAICFEGIVIGTIPFAFVSIPLLIKNGYFIGMALVFCKEISGTSIMKLLVFEILPHGVFEISALLLSMSIGIHLCLSLTKKLLNIIYKDENKNIKNGKKDDVKIKDLFKEYLRLVIFLILPLIVLAGFIEAYITPIL